MADTIFKQLLEKYLTRSISSGERDQLFQMLRKPMHDEELNDIISEQWAAGIFDADINDGLRQAIFQKIQQRKDEKPGFVSSRTLRRIAVAASIILVIGLGIFVIARRETTKQSPVAQTQQERFKNDVDPGKYKARLMLADGSTIVLDSLANGELAKQGNTVVLNKNGQLVYDASPSPKGEGRGEVLYNTLSTTKGETYTTVLADGSKVWLNSASSIKYPVAFVGNERRAEITGEAYFEIKHNDKMPFKVSVNGIEVQDLGTEFNINAYNDEAVIKTTLVSGSAKVVKGNSNQLLSPGQQIQVGSNNEMKLINNADVEEAVAWIKGKFQFQSTDIESLMRQIARWYDVEVVYQESITKKFSGKIPRTMTAANVFKVLEETGGVRFKIDGKKVTVMK